MGTRTANVSIPAVEAGVTSEDAALPCQNDPFGPLITRRWIGVQTPADFLIVKLTMTPVIGELNDPAVLDECKFAFHIVHEG